MLDRLRHGEDAGGGLLDEDESGHEGLCGTGGSDGVGVQFSGGLVESRNTDIRDGRWLPSIPAFL